MDQAALRNRLILATAMWKDATRDPLPRMPAGDPETQLQGFELKLVELLCAQATAGVSAPRGRPDVGPRPRPC